MSMNPDPLISDEKLTALFQAARAAPPPRAADKLAIGFGPRAEARLRDALAEAAGLERLLVRGLAACGLCAAVALLVVFLRPADPPRGPGFADVWTRSTAPPALWARPE